MKTTATIAIIIRKATITDSEKILPLWIKLMEFHSNENVVFQTSPDFKEKVLQNIQKLITQPSVTFFIAELDGDIVAYSMTTITSRPAVFAKTRKGYIGDTYVTDSLHRRGIGSNLIATIKKWFKDQNVEFIELQVTKTNESGKKFWEKNGFSTVSYYMVNDLNK